MLKVCEVYTSILGETSLSGLAACIIRLSGCNLKCRWCDTQYALKRGKTYDIERLMGFVRRSGLRYVLVTGGEPLMQRESFRLIKRLLRTGKEVIVETNGTYLLPKMDNPNLTWVIDIKPPSSGMQYKHNIRNADRLRPWDEIKCVISDITDLHYALQVLCIYNHPCPDKVLLSPLHSTLDAKTLAAWMVKYRLPFRLNMQLHKVIWSPEARRV